MKIIIRTVRSACYEKVRKLLATTLMLLVLIAMAVRGQSALDGFDPNANEKIRVVVERR